MRAVFARRGHSQAAQIVLNDCDRVVVQLQRLTVAVIVALPGPTPVTTPAASTVATCGIIGSPVNGNACSRIAVEDARDGVEWYVAAGYERRL